MKKIRIHDLRHSHVAHFIELGFSPVAIAERMGHEGINITFNYAHLYPSKQKALADKLNEDRGDVAEEFILENEDRSDGINATDDCGANDVDTKKKKEAY